MTDVKERLQGLSEQDEQQQTDGEGDETDTDKVEDRTKIQCLVPPVVKIHVEEAWQKINAICSLSGREVPLKNDFYSAVLIRGADNLEDIADSLGISDAYDEYRDVIE